LASYTHSPPKQKISKIFLPEIHLLQNSQSLVSAPLGDTESRTNLETNLDHPKTELWRIISGKSSRKAFRPPLKVYPERTLDMEIKNIPASRTRVAACEDASNVYRLFVSADVTTELNGCNTKSLS